MFATTTNLNSDHCFRCLGNETVLTQCTTVNGVISHPVGINVTCMSHDEVARTICSTSTQVQSNECLATTPSTCVATTITINSNENATSDTRREIDDNIVVFKVITGILLVLLIAVIMGWILTCVVMQKKKKKSKRR